MSKMPRYSHYFCLLISTLLSHARYSLLWVGSGHQKTHASVSMKDRSSENFLNAKGIVTG